MKSQWLISYYVIQLGKVLFPVLKQAQTPDTEGSLKLVCLALV